MNIQEVVEQARIRAKMPPISDLFSSTDETALEFLGYANMMANKIFSENDWQYLKEDHEFTTTGYITENLPCDYASIMTYYIYDKSRNERIRNETDDESLSIVASKTISQSDIRFRLLNGKIKFTFAPDEGRELLLTYKKKNFVNTNDVETQYFTENASEFMLNDELLILGIVWKRAESLMLASEPRAFKNYLEKLDQLKQEDEGKRKFNILGDDDLRSNRTTDGTWGEYP